MLPSLRAEVTVYRNNATNRPWIMIWAAPHHFVYSTWDTKDEAIAAAHRFTIGSPKFPGEMFSNVGWAPVSVPSTATIEAWIEVADVMLADALSKKGV